MEVHTNKVEKRGWLKKQGGLVRNWQMRWFVLKGKRLLYYTKDDESKMVNSIDLTNARLEEIPYNREEPERYMFEITTVGKTSEVYPIWASSEPERTGWLSALRRVIYKERGGGVFGGELSEVMAYDKAKFGYSVPHIVYHCVEHIRKEGRETEGIFRLSGRLAQVREFRKLYDEGGRPEVESCDIHTVASLLKLYLRELPEPVIPYEYFEPFLNLATSFRYNSNHDENFSRLKDLVFEIPENNLLLLRYLSEFLNEISEYQHINKMTEQNISVIFGTNILRSEDNSPEFEMATQNLTTHVVLAFVKWHDKLFRPTSDDPDSVRVDQKEFEQLVSISEAPLNSSIDLGMDNSTISLNTAADLIGLEFAASGSLFQSEQDTQKLGIQENQPPMKTDPPAIPRRSIDGDLSDSVQLQASGELCPPVPTPRNGRAEPSPVTRRPASTRRVQRPTAVVDPGESVPKRQSATLPAYPPRVSRAPSNFQSYIDSPLDSRISLNIGDLPTDVNDLHSLVFSLKLQLKAQRHDIEQLEREKAQALADHKQAIDKMAQTIHAEQVAKDDAIMRIVTLTNQLALYQSQYGILEE